MWVEMCEYLNFLVKKNKQKDFAINSMEKELTYTHVMNGSQGWLDYVENDYKPTD